MRNVLKKNGLAIAIITGIIAAAAVAETAPTWRKPAEMPAPQRVAVQPVQQPQQRTNSIRDEEQYERREFTQLTGTITNLMDAVTTAVNQQTYDLAVQTSVTGNAAGTASVGRRSRNVVSPDLDYVPAYSARPRVIEVSPRLGTYEQTPSR